MTFWYGSDPQILAFEKKDLYLAPADPAIFVTDLQDANEKLFLLLISF